MPHLTMDQNVWAVVGGVFTGFLLTLVGGGGSALAVPILTSLVGLTRVRVVMGTTAVAIAATALSSAVAHARRGTVKWPVAVSFTVPGILGIMIGTHLQNGLPSHLLLTLLGVVMLLNASFVVRMPREGTELSLAARMPVWVRFAPVGLAVGVLAGTFGMGGGFLALPSMVVGGLSLSSAVGSSIVSVGSLGLASALNYTLRGLVDWRVAIEYVTGGVFGSFLAAPLSAQISKKGRMLPMVLAMVLTGLSLYLIANNIRPLYTSHGVL